MSDVSEIQDVLDPDFTQRVAAIICFERTYGIDPGRLFEVELDPAKVSPSRRFIRIKGEANGWFAVAAIVVVEILAEWDGVKFKPVESESEEIKCAAANG